MARKDTCTTLAKVGADEPIFVLRAQDMLAPEVVFTWSDLAEQAGVSAEKVDEARECAIEMANWRNRKIPD